MSSIERKNRSIHSIDQRFNNNYSGNHLESQELFRACPLFSIYSIREDRILTPAKTIWDKQNLGGIPVDYDKETQQVYVDSSESHTLLIGSTGSKKTRLICMPLIRILAAAGESMIISDPKAEIYKRTVDNLKQKNYHVHLLNFRDPQFSDGWNLFSMPYQLYRNGEIDKSLELVNDTAITLMPIQAKDPYWDYSARDLFIGLTLLLFKICAENNYPDNAVNIRNLLNIRADMFKSLDNDLIKKTIYWKYAGNDEIVINKLIGTVGLNAKNTMSCILSTFDQHISCFSLSPKLSDVLSTSTFSFDRIGYEKNAIFIILPDEKTTYHKLAAIFIKQCYENLLEQAYKFEKSNRFPRRINYVLDEFSSLPIISDFPQMISASRSRNIRFHIIMQSQKQLIQKYEGETETIQSNCGNWMFLYSKELDLLKEISELCGKNENEYLVPLYRLQHLSKEEGECLVFANRLYPYFAFLPDINEYDGGEIGSVVFPNFNKKNKRFDVTNALNDKNKASQDIQIELENKFDELFGDMPD